MAPTAATAELADGSVTTPKLADGAVNFAKLAAEALARMPLLPLTSENLANGAVTTTKLADNAVTLAKLASDVVSRLGAPGYGLVTTDNIADGAVTSAKIADGTIQTTDLAENAVTRTYQVSSVGDASTTSSSWVDIPEMSVTITTDGGPVLIMFSGNFETSPDNRRVYIQVSIDGTLKDASTRFAQTYATWITHGTSWLETLSPGAHTISIQWVVVDAGSTVYTRHRAMQVIELKR
jgi:hypothetical protein